MLPIKCLKTSILNSEKDKQYDGRKKIHSKINDDLQNTKTLDVNSGLLYTTFCVVYLVCYLPTVILSKTNTTATLFAAMFVLCFDSIRQKSAYDSIITMYSP